MWEEGKKSLHLGTISCTESSKM